MYKGDMETARASPDPEQADALLPPFFDKGTKACFVVRLSACYGRIRPGVGPVVAGDRITGGIDGLDPIELTLTEAE